MGEADFEGTLVLEQLAAIAAIDAFFEAVDGDDLGTAERLMQRARVDAATIAVVLRMMAAADGEL